MIGSSGLLVVKDFTSILSMNRDTRALVLAALREIYDGHWTRNVGTDGGFTLTWRGPLVVIGAVTTAWDAAHQVVATMGDRFVLVRLERTGSTIAARPGCRPWSTSAPRWRCAQQLSRVTGKLLPAPPSTADEPSRGSPRTRWSLLGLADLVTRARTAVERDYQGNPAWAHGLEMPTRFAKQLVQIARGGLLLGMDRETAMGVAARCCHDTMPPLRRRVLADVAGAPGLVHPRRGRAGAAPQDDRRPDAAGAAAARPPRSRSRPVGRQGPVDVLARPGHRPGRPRPHLYQECQ